MRDRWAARLSGESRRLAVQEASSWPASNGSASKPAEKAASQPRAPKADLGAVTRWPRRAGRRGAVRSHVAHAWQPVVWLRVAPLVARERGTRCRSRHHNFQLAGVDHRRRPRPGDRKCRSRRPAVDSRPELPQHDRERVRTAPVGGVGRTHREALSAGRFTWSLPTGGRLPWSRPPRARVPKCCLSTRKGFILRRPTCR